MKVIFPDKSHTTSCGSTNVMGTFPIGARTYWHGGVHFENTTLEIGSIAEGHVIAYRLSDDYFTIKDVEGTDILYSNSFVLIQHHYQSKKEQELFFYSLYHHLLPKSKYEVAHEVPYIFANKAAFTGTGTKVEKGLELFLGNKKNRKPETCILLPQGLKVTIEDKKYFSTPADDKSEGTKFDADTYVIVSCSIQGEKYEGCTRVSSAYLTPGFDKAKITANDLDKRYTAKIKYVKDVADTSKHTIHKGVFIWEDEKKTTLLDILPKDLKLEILSKTDKLLKVKVQYDSKELTGYIQNNDASIVYKSAWKDDISLNSVVNCKIPVKAGDSIGFGGMYGCENQKQYRSMHFEVFTDDENTLKEFLTNVKQDSIDGEKVRNAHLKLPETLKGSFEYQLLGDTEIRLLQEKDDYCQILIGKVRRQADRNSNVSDGAAGYSANRRTYTLKKDGSSDLFNGLLIQGDVLNLLDTDDEIKKRDKASINNQKIRNVEYAYPISDNIFWIHKDNIAKIECTVAYEDVIATIDTLNKKNYYIDHSKKGKLLGLGLSSSTLLINAEKAADNFSRGSHSLGLSANAICDYITYWVKDKHSGTFIEISGSQLKTHKFKGARLKQSTAIALNIIDTSTITVKLTHLSPPKEGIEDKKVPDRIIVPLSECLEFAQNSRKKWRYAQTVDYYGYFEENKVSLFPPENWDKFGFKMFKDEANKDKYLFSLDEKNGIMGEYLDTYESVKPESDTLPPTISRISHNPDFVRKISKLVVYHRTEWAYDDAKALEKLKKEFEDLLDERISEAPTDKREEMTEEKNIKLQNIEDKAKNLSFWGSVSVKTSEEEEKKEKEVTLKEFPKVPYVYHFHPIAFVEQMKRNDNESFQIIFPFKEKPLNDKDSSSYPNRYWAADAGANSATYKSYRDKTRNHAGRDLYGTTLETVIVAICDGVVLGNNLFYNKTNEIAILHTTNDGRKFIARYGEVSPDSVKIKINDTVVQGQEIAKVGKLDPKVTIDGKTTNMLHFEYFTGTEGYNLNKALTYKGTGANEFQRRADIADPLPILQEGYENTFGGKTEKSDENRIPVAELAVSQEGVDFIKSWEGTEKNVDKSRHIAYDDSEDYATIGYGHLIAKVKCSDIVYTGKTSIGGITKDEFEKGITEARAIELLKSDLKTAEAGVKKDITVPLHQHEYDALVSLLYNAGAAFLRTGGAGKGDTKIKKNINNQNYEAGANEFLDVTNGGVAGLVRRRKAEVTMFKTNVYNNN